MCNRVGYNERIVGRCGKCGGLVTIPTVWWSVVPPRPTCKNCGAVVAERDNLPILPMDGGPNRWDWRLKDDDNYRVPYKRTHNQWSNPNYMTECRSSL